PTRRLSRLQEGFPTLGGAAPYAWWLLGSVNSTPSARLTCSLPMSPLGVPCVRASTIATRAVAVCFASAVIHWPISPPWNSPCSLLVCHPRKKQPIGEYYQEGRGYCTESRKVNDHDFAEGIVNS